ncbi:biotin synthase BioB [Endozoicomonas montiporae]|uniref:biotin synthase BioB n=1 Tax=Endozoicomonas montiporae TaxID=1027273 RepID=UPI0022A986A8|nr:biotin synthase BioB [Endozoicomonas montiporae]
MQSSQQESEANPLCSLELPVVRHDWNRAEVEALFALPFNDLMYRAQQTHRLFFDPNRIQLSTLLSIKTGACPEDCKYCPQSGHYNTGLEKEKLMAVETVLERAKQAKANGATRFCMGAAWRSPTDKDLSHVIQMIRSIKALGMETCVTLGMLSPEQSRELAAAGLDYYNHNLDTSPEYYGDIITTRTFSDRMDTLANVQEAGINVCCGGILGMGESVRDRASMLRVLANLPEHPGSVPINLLVRVKGTPLGETEELDPLEFIRTIAVARILMPRAHVRLSAGRRQMDELHHTLCFMAGANSLFLGEKLLVTPLPDSDEDMALFDKLGMKREEKEVEPLYYDAAAG